MEPLNTRLRIAIIIIAVVSTAGLSYLAVKAMHWLFAYVGSFGQGGPHPMLPVVGGVVIAIIVLLRFYFRRRAAAARAKK
jgi:hypothetical protein